MTDKRTVTMVVAFLGVFALAGLLSSVWLIDHERDASNIAIVAGMTGTALGALGGILASTRTQQEPQPVIGPGGGPVPVEDA